MSSLWKSKFYDKFWKSFFTYNLYTYDQQFKTFFSLLVWNFLFTVYIYFLVIGSNLIFYYVCISYKTASNGLRCICLLTDSQNFFLIILKNTQFTKGKKGIVKNSSKSPVVSGLIPFKAESQPEKHQTTSDSVKILGLRVETFTYLYLLVMWL